MAEFQEVIKHWGRMLDAHRHGESIALEASVPADAFNDAKQVEEIVMAWAAEHPEPVYLTWGTWLTEKYGYDLREIMYDPIPADIAETLKIPPKEECP